MRYVAEMRPLACVPLLTALAIGCSSDSESSKGSDSGTVPSREAGPQGEPSGGRDAGSVVGNGGAARDSGSGGAGTSARDASPDGSEQTPDAGHRDSGIRDAGGPTKSGFVIVASHATGSTSVFTSSAGAGFYDGPGNTYANGCRREVTGACSVLQCNFTDGGAETPAPGAPQSAGTVTIDGTTPAFVFDYDAASGRYLPSPAVPADRLLFAGGDMLTFAASGDTVPAFSDSLVAPAPLVVTAPSLAGGVLSIDTSRDFLFTWEGASAGQLSFNVRSATSASGMVFESTFVSCQFSASALSGAIPSTLLRRLAKTGASTTATLGTDLSNAKEVVAGDYDVHLAVGSYATTGDGTTPYATTQVTIH